MGPDPVHTHRGHVAVVGAGITGLSAAHALATSPQRPKVTILEADEVPGGKLRTGSVGGARVELGADAFLARDPDAVDLCRAVGLGDDLVDQSARGVGVWWDGRLRRLPEGVILGVPTRFRPLLRSGLVSPSGLLRAGLDLALPPTPSLDERSVGELVRHRLGDEVADRLVEPLLAGVYAGDIDRLGVTAATPVLADAARQHRSLVLGLRARARRSRPQPGPATDGPSGPVFVGLRGGLSSLVARLVATPRVELRTGHRVTSLEFGAGGFRLDSIRGDVAADGVILALPAPAAADLVRPHLPDAARALTEIAYASVAVVVIVLPPGTRLPAGSGILIPRSAGRTVKAATWVSQKWAHVGDGQVVVRASVGRAGDARILDRPDDEIAETVLADLADLVGIRAEPSAVEIIRWPASMPQYEVGHERRVGRIREGFGTIPGLEVAGAALGGIGIPACVRQGREAARTLLV
jgi:protoporphyrinogen/coproporphyrinogen III oxidase